MFYHRKILDFVVFGALLFLSRALLFFFRALLFLVLRSWAARTLPTPPSCALTKGESRARSAAKTKYWWISFIMKVSSWGRCERNDWTGKLCTFVWMIFVSVWGGINHFKETSFYELLRPFNAIVRKKRHIQVMFRVKYQLYTSIIIPKEPDIHIIKF